MNSPIAKRVGPYVDLVPLEGTVDMFLGRDSRFPTNETILARVFPRQSDGSFSPARFLEPKLLASSTSPHVPRLGDAGYDEDFDQHYYSMVLTAPVGWFTWELASMTERCQAIVRLSEALSELHESGLVYRSFRRSPVAVAGDITVLCDFSRAARVDPAGLVPGFARLESFDPPEASRKKYDGRAGDMYGLGILCRDVGLEAGELAGLVANMTTSDAALRPRSMREVRRAVSEAIDRLSPP